MQHQHLTVAKRTGAYADGRNRNLLRDLGREVERYAFDDNRARAGLFHRVGVVEQALATTGLEAARSALYLVAAHAVEALRRETDVADDGNVDAGECLNGLTHHHTTLQLDALCAFLHQPDGALDRLLRTDLIRAEGQVADDQGTRLCSRNKSYVVHHVVESDRDRVVLALHHHADRIPDEDHVDPGKVHEAGERDVVRSDHRDLLAECLHPSQLGDRDLRSVVRLVGHEAIASFDRGENIPDATAKLSTSAPVPKA